MPIARSDRTDLADLSETRFPLAVSRETSRLFNIITASINTTYTIAGRFLDT
jgi:hypothetical protein